MDELVDTGSAVLTPDEVKKVRAVLYLNGLRGADIDDAAQDVNVRVLEHAGRVENRKAWACAVATRIALDKHRRASSRRNALARLRLVREESWNDPDIALRESVRKALADLDPDLRATVVLRYFADLQVGDIATLMDVAEGTVKSRLHRAAGILRKDLGGNDEQH